MFSAPVLIGNQQGFFVHHGGLDTRPGAHIDADLFPHEPAENKCRGGQNADRRIGNGGCTSGPEITNQSRCIGEIHDPCAAGPEGDEKPDRPFAEALGDFLGSPRCFFEPHLGVAIAVDKPFDMLEKVRPDGLGTAIAAPCTADGTGDQKQTNTRHDEKSDHIVKFVRPDFDLEHVETPVGKIDKHRLVRRIGTSVPADPRRDVVNRQRHRHDDPFQSTEKSVDCLGIDAFSGLVERLVGAGQVFRAGHWQRPFPGRGPPSVLHWLHHRPANGHRRPAS